MAGQIPPQFIDELLTRVDIVDIIDRRVPLKKAGRNLQACCPFHNEKSPSFTVSPEKQFYHCFGCGAHGTAVGFLMEYEQLSFPEAIQELADSVSMTVPRQANTHVPDHRQDYELMAKVSAYYTEQLQYHSQSAQFRGYLAQRGLSAKTITKFNIGMAPPGWDNIMKTFSGASREGVKQLDRVGLLSQNDQGRQYDRFRQRIMFPIMDRRGRIIGFGGRVLDDSTPKYLNSPETPLFHKGNELYGLYQVRKANRHLERIIIVEGYMDVIALAEKGINNAVATLGTATTIEHLKQLQRLAPEVVFCFDGDRAGRDAAWRAAENALSMLGGNQQLKFMFLPDGQDPDSLVREQGVEGFQRQLKTAIDYSDFFLDNLANRVDISSMDGRARLIEIARPYIRHIPEGVYRDMLEQQLATRAKTDPALLDKYLDKPAKAASPRVQRSENRGISAIRMAITILIQQPNLAAVLENHHLLKPLNRPGISLLVGLIDTLLLNPNLTTAGLLERYRDTKNANHLEKLAMQTLSLESEALREELLGAFKQLQQEAVSFRHQRLVEKGLANLSQQERQEIQELELSMKR